MRNKKQLLWKILLVVSLLIFSLAGTYIYMYFSSGKSQDQYKTPNTEETQALTTETSSQPPLADNPVDWDKLQSDNPDIYAWITIPNTKIDYAIAQSSPDKSDSFYLTHNLRGEYEFAGCIYSEKHNALDFSDYETVLYGHNMLNGSMFAGLHKFESTKFFNNNQYLYVYTPGHKLTYEVYSAFVYDDRHILNSFDFNNKSERMKFFKSTLDPTSMSSNIRDGVTLDKNSHVLTLSTCTNTSDTTRYLVNSVLVKDEMSE